MKMLIKNGGERRPYEEWVSIELSHEYYDGTPCPALLVPDAATVRRLQHNGILLRKRYATQCSLIAGGDSGEINLTDEDVYLQFEIRTSDERFHYVSQSCEEDASFSIVDSGVCGVWRTITLNPLVLAGMMSKQLKVRINAPEKHIEYLCIPKYNKPDLNLRMSDDSNSLFLTNPPEQVSLPGIPTAWKFVTKEKVRLKQHSEVKTTLWEIRDHGERVIGNAIPFPRPEQFSPLSPNDTITSFFYY